VAAHIGLFNPTYPTLRAAARAHPHLLQIRAGDVQRQQVGLREVAVVGQALLAPHAVRDAAALVEQPRLLHHLVAAPAAQQPRLPPRRGSPWVPRKGICHSRQAAVPGEAAQCQGCSVSLLLAPACCHQTPGSAHFPLCKASWEASTFPGAAWQARAPGRAWRSISKSIARCMAENEFMFLTSTLVPKRARPAGRTDTFTSHRMEPSCRRSRACLTRHWPGRLVPAARMPHHMCTCKHQHAAAFACLRLFWDVRCGSPRPQKRLTVKEEPRMVRWPLRAERAQERRACMLPSVMPKKTMMRRSSAAYAAASTPLRMSGSDTISSSGTPAGVGAGICHGVPGSSRSRPRQPACRRRP